MYSGDEFYGDDVTSPLARPVAPLRPAASSIRRPQVRKARRAIRRDLPSIYDQCADLYGDPFNAIPMNGTDYHTFGEQ